MLRALVPRMSAVALALLLGACVNLPPGVPPADAEDPLAGTLTLPSGHSVKVRPQDLEYTGEARFQWPDGRIYDGTWLAGQPHGDGRETLPDGTRYQGSWRDGLHHGQGTLVIPGGDRFSGTFAAGVREGEGTLESGDGTYQGEWSADLPHGEGIFQASDGTRYEGEWRRGQRFGGGTYTTPDGSRYEGDWAYDQPHGFGSLEGPDGTRYEGEWQNGRQHGYGRLEEASGLAYEGIWLEGEKHGFGREERPDGSSYEGDWQQGKRHGQGRETHPDGSFHEGQWELNQPLGPGRQVTPEGVEISGMWNSERVSTGLLRLPTGLEYAGPLFADGADTASPRLLRWLEQTARHGDPYAQYLLGTFRLDLQEPAPDVREARRWLRPAAAAGIADAQYRLALTYESANPPRVVELLSQAAESRHANANALLGDYYYGGVTVPRSLERAIHYYERAVSAGSTHARNNLAWLLATTLDERFRNGERAVDLIRPIALFTGAWQYLDTLAAAWAATGNFDQATATAQRALDAVDDDPGVEALTKQPALEQRLARYRARQPLYEDEP